MIGFQSNSSLDIPNHRGDTPLSMLQVFLGERWISPKVVEKVRENSVSNRSQNFFYKMAKDKVLSLNIYFLCLMLNILIFF